MENIKNKILTVASVGVLVTALNVTGVFGTFFTPAERPTDQLCSLYGYQSGYGYGYDCKAPSITETGGLKTTFVADTIVKDSDGNSVDVEGITLVAVTDVELGTGKNTVATVDFGISGKKLIFSKPVKLEIPVTGVTSDTVKIEVKHEGDSSYGTVGLTNSDGTCDSDGNATPTNNIADVVSGIATIYTCSASTFVAYTDDGSESTTSGGLGDAKGIDVCPGNIDNSGDFYDRTCDASGTSSSNTDTNSDNDNSGNDSNDSNDSNDDNSGNGSDETSNNNDNETPVEGATDVVNHGDYVTPESTQSCVTIKAVLDTNFNPNYVNRFTDINNSVYKNIILKFAKAGVVSGTSPTTFEPNRGITRAEFLAIVLKTHCKDFDLGSENPGFPDVSSTSWQAKVVKKGVALGIINGYSDGTFKPNRIISKAEAYGIVSNMAILSSKSVANDSYTDLEAEWQKVMTRKLEFLGVLKPASDGYKFRPNSAVNRDQMLNFINKVIELY